MTKVKIGIIGGSGLSSLQGINFIKTHHIDTPFGQPSDEITEAKIGETSFYFIPRHGGNHTISPSEVNYRANVFAMKLLGVKYLLSISAVGSLRNSCAPGSFVLPNQFIDWTKGKREKTFFGNGMVGHVPSANLVQKDLKGLIFECCEKLNIKCQKGGSYICIEGPQFSTKAESEIYRSFGASVIGMTNMPEALLAKEAGFAYATVAMVTDYDCWKDEHCTVKEIIKVMKENVISVNKLLERLLPLLDKSNLEIIKENENCVITKENALTDKNREILEVLMR